MHALYTFLWTVFFSPYLLLAQQTPPAEPLEPAARGAAGWLWLVVLAIAIVALVAWGLSRGTRRGGPPVAR